MKLAYTIPESLHSYRPDWELPNGVLLEAKGLFTSEDRKKHILVKAQHPHLDLRFIFSNANAKLTKQSKTTYAMWADKNGFKWAHKTIPKEWLDECTTHR